MSDALRFFAKVAQQEGSLATSERDVIVDPTQPFLDIGFFERCSRAAKAVARLESDVEPLGTAFLISRSLVLTAYENIFDGQGRVYPELSSVRVLFDYASAFDGTPLAAIQREVAIASIVGEREAHWALMPLTRPAPRRFPTLDLDPIDLATVGKSAHIIHHPEGQRKKVSLGNNNIVHLDQHTFSYTTNTTAGTSGAPVFNHHWDLIGLHYKSDPAVSLNRAVSIERVRRGLRIRGINPGADDTLQSSGPPHVYISACAQDRDIVDKLEAYLAPLRRAGKTSIWHQGKVAPGTRVVDAVREQLRSASIILLLMSADYMNSDDAMAEATAALSLPHRPVVIPVLGRPCLWEQAPFGMLQPLPEERLPLIRPFGTEDAFVGLARAIGAVLTDGEF